MEPIIITSELQLEQLLEKTIRRILSDSKPEANTSKKPLTVKEAAEYLNISPATLYGYTSKRLIPHHKPGKVLYFYQDELDTWLKESRQLTADQLENFSQIKKGGKK